MPANPPSLYMHFLDRELGDSVGFSASSSTYESVLKVMALGFPATFYCGVSIIWENPGLDKDCRSFIALLAESRMLDAASHNSTVEEFHESRRRLYAHDAARYPLYFDSKPSRFQAIRPTLHKPQGTTRALVRMLTEWSDLPEGRAPSQSRADDLSHAKMLVGQSIREREAEAVTYAYFQPFVLRSDGSPHDAGVIRRQISLAYASNYLEFAAGDIPTGIRGLSFFDSALSTSFPLYDIEISRELLHAIGFRLVLQQPWRINQAFWSTYLFQFRETAGYLLSIRMRRTLEGLYEMLPMRVRASSQYVVRKRMVSILRESREDVTEQHVGLQGGAPQIEQEIARAQMRLARLETRLRSDGYLAPDPAHSFDVASRVRSVLIMTATSVETEAVMRAFAESTGDRYTKIFGETTTYFRLGTLGGSDIFLVQSEAGSGGPAGSALTATEAINFIKPGAILVVGIAFGVDPVEQKIGDVLVSRQMISYESQRIGRGGSTAAVISRGDRASASPRLLDRCRTAKLEWDRCAVHFGPILSGEKLVDNADYRALLTTRFDDEVVGGEMEGAGVHAAAHRHGTDWIVIKAISDWADGEKSHHKGERQRTAATNASDFVMQVLRNGNVVAS